MAIIKNKNGEVIFDNDKVTDKQVAQYREMWKQWTEDVTYERAVELSGSACPAESTAVRNREKLTADEKVKLKAKLEHEIVECKKEIKRCQNFVKESLQRSKDEMESGKILSGEIIIKDVRNYTRKEIKHNKERIAWKEQVIKELDC